MAAIQQSDQHAIGERNMGSSYAYGAARLRLLNIQLRDERQRDHLVYERAVRGIDIG